MGSAENTRFSPLPSLWGQALPTRSPERIGFFTLCDVLIFHDKHLMRWFPTHSLSFLLVGMTTRAILRRNGEPLRDQNRRVSQREMFDLGDELQRAASAVAISETAPHVLVEIDHELRRIAALVNGTAAAQRRPDALELGVETIVRDDERQRNEMLEWWKTIALSMFNNVACACGVQVVGVFARWLWL